MSRLPTALVALLVLGGCSSGGHVNTSSMAPATTTNLVYGKMVDVSSDPNTTERVIDVPVTEAWQALVKVYEELGVEITFADTRQLVVGNRNLKVRRQFAGMPLSRLLDCGISPVTGHPNADRYNVDLSLVTRLEARGNETVVHTQLDALARPAGHSNTPVRCSTTGDLESHIAHRIVTRPSSAD